MEEKYQVTIIQDNIERVITCSESETVLQAIQRQGLAVRADCGGRGTCGKCRIRLCSGALTETQFDRKAFTSEELQAGYRLACKAIPTEDIVVILSDSGEAKLKGITENRIRPDVSYKADRFSEGYIIGIDLGTTTLAFCLADVNGAIIAEHSSINPQRSYGADVLSRMKASNEGRKEQLRILICEALMQGIDLIIRKADISINAIKLMVVAGNTTMIHLLMGYSCEGLGAYPFTPVNLDTIRLSYRELFLWNKEENGKEALEEVPVHILPGISTFVGGDILAGLAACGYITAEKPSLLIDFGTNGEIALGSRECIFVTSTAAGPAFEGGNISCGAGSVPGAICHVKQEKDKLIYETIGNQPPVGICGTGVVDLAAELFRSGAIDETGLLIDEYFHEGYPIISDEKSALRFTQKDIRELQLAKAAVRAGIELSLLRASITYDQIDQVFLAGGFGFSIAVDNAVLIGLLPDSIKEKVIVIGNSSLAGAIQYAVNSEFIDRVERIKAISREIHLSMDEEFNELFLEYMSFA